MTTSDVLRERPIERASDRIDEQCQFTQVRHVAVAALVEMRCAHTMMHATRAIACQSSFPHRTCSEPQPFSMPANASRECSPNA